MLSPDEKALIYDVKPLGHFIVVDDERLDVLLPLKLVHPAESVAQTVAGNPDGVNVADAPFEIVKRQASLQFISVGGDDCVQDPLVHFELRLRETLRKALQERLIGGR